MAKIALSKYLKQCADETIAYYESRAGYDEKASCIVQQCKVFKEWIKEYNQLEE